MNHDGTLLLTRHDIAQLLNIDECIAAVERAFKIYGEGKAAPPGILGMHARHGGFHIKAGFLKEARNYFACKINANFPQNKMRFALPTIQGVIILSDGENGQPLAVMDSIEITIQRTGAATAVAAKYLARRDAKVATICGCGIQGRIQLRALSRVLSLQHVFLFDIDEGQARSLADEFSGELLAEPIAQKSLAAAVKKSAVCVTCTPSTTFYLRRDDVAAGTFISAVGADSEQKQEIDPELFVSTKIVVDVLQQCVEIGDLHHAIEKRLVEKSDVHAELGEIVAGIKSGRTSKDEIVIFDSTGMALQDAATAALVYEKALAAKMGTRLKF
jgi:alanine dehydrogenase